jgi:hypothetical protein
MHTKSPTPRDRLSLELLTSPPRNKSGITFKSLVVDLKKDEKQTYLNEIGGGGGKKLNAIST